MKNTYWNEAGKYQEFVNKASDKMPDIGYTDNPHMNLFICMSHLYYDAYNNGGCNIEDCYLKDFNRYVKPLLPNISVRDFLSGNEAKIEDAMDTTVAYLQDKNLDYQVYSVWKNTAENVYSLAEPAGEGAQAWTNLTFGDKQERDLWCKQESHYGARDLTKEMEAKQLPAFCYSVLQSSGELILLNKGQSGYYQSDYNTPSADGNRALAQHLNELLGVSEPQRMAMEFGSMFGWDKPGADPSKYMKEPLAEKVRDAAERKPVAFTEADLARHGKEGRE